MDSPLPPTLSKETVSLATILTFPAFPCPRVAVLKKLPLLTESDPVVMLMSPPLPTALCPTRWNTPVSVGVPFLTPLMVIASVALISTFPALLSTEPKFGSIPARSWLPARIFRFRALTAILPPPEARTFTPAPLVRDTSVRATPSGKLKLRIWLSILSPPVPAPATPPNSTRPPGACKFPPSKLTLPPSNNKL